MPQNIVCSEFVGNTDCTRLRLEKLLNRVVQTFLYSLVSEGLIDRFSYEHSVVSTVDLLVFADVHDFNHFVLLQHANHFFQQFSTIVLFG